jgi:hypothetical protein
MTPCRRWAACAALLVAFPTVSGAQTPASASSDSIRIVLEPGLLHSTGEAILPIRIFDAAGAARRASESALAVEIDGRRADSFDVVSPASRIAIVIDPSAILPSDRSAWAQEIARLGSGAGGGDTRLFLCGKRLREVTGFSAEDAALALQDVTGAPLYDGVLESIRRLSAESSALERRCVLVAASGTEAMESRHPVVTCITAADTARVAIYAVILPAAAGKTTGEARLRELASRTGGSWTTAGIGPQAASLSSMLARMRAVEAIHWTNIAAPAGAKHVVKVIAPDAAATGSLAPRAFLGLDEARRFPWPMLVLGGALLAGATAFGFTRTRPRGRLVVVRGSRPDAIPVTHAGVTIGSAPGNRLVLDDAGISRHHAVVQLRRGLVTFVDLKSTNGTRVNGARITVKPLSDGDRILLAEAVELVYERRPRGPISTRTRGSERIGEGTKPTRSQRRDDDDDDVDA